MRDSTSFVPAGKTVRRVMFFGKSMSRSRCAPALVEALREQGFEVKWINRATLRRWLGSAGADKWIRRSFARFKPDLVFVFWEDLPLDLLREFKEYALTVSWFEESPEELDVSHVEYLGTPHVVGTSNLAAIDTLRQAGHHNAVFQMAGFSPSFHYPVTGARIVRDVAYMGGAGRQGQRAALLAKVAEKHRVQVFGSGWGSWKARFPGIDLQPPVKPPGFRRVCATSHIVLGINEVNHIPFYFSNRTFLVLGCGGFLLTSYVPGLEEVFKDGVHLAWFKSEAECLDKISFYLERKELCRKIAGSGHRLAMHQHRYLERATCIMDILYRGFEADRSTERLLQQARSLGGSARLVLAAETTT